MYKITGASPSPFYENMMVYYILCDTPSDLPSTISDIGYGTAIGYGSRADIISDSSKYLWNGSQWVRQTTGQEIEISADDIVYDNTDSGMTATNVQDAIDEIKDLDDTQDNALAELYGVDANQQLEIDYSINTGAKNLCPYNQITATAAGTVINDQPINLSSGTYILSFDHTATTGSTAFRFLKDGVSVLSFTVTNSSAGKESRSFTLPSEANQIRMYTDVANTYTDIMIREDVIRNSTFEPYAPTNRELYETKVSKEDVFGLGTALTTGLDLNSITDIGTYYAPSTTIAQSLLNCPASYTFRLEVKTINGTNRYMQTIYEVSTANGQIAIYRRAYTVNGWQSWYKFEGTQVATVQSVNSLSTLNLSRNELNEQLDTNFNLLDSIPEEEEGEEDV